MAANLAVARTCRCVRRRRRRCSRRRIQSAVYERHDHETRSGTIQGATFQDIRPTNGRNEARRATSPQLRAGTNDETSESPRMAALVDAVKRLISTAVRRRRRRRLRRRRCRPRRRRRPRRPSAGTSTKHDDVRDDRRLEPHDATRPSTSRQRRQSNVTINSTAFGRPSSPPAVARCRSPSLIVAANTRLARSLVSFFFLLHLKARTPPLREAAVATRRSEERSALFRRPRRRSAVAKKRPVSGGRHSLALARRRRSSTASMKTAAAQPHRRHRHRHDHRPTMRRAVCRALVALIHDSSSSVD